MDASQREIKRVDGTSIKTTDMMEVYFRRIEALISSNALDARHSFMLQDLVDLRRENWVERRKVGTCAINLLVSCKSIDLISAHHAIAVRRT